MAAPDISNIPTVRHFGRRVLQEGAALDALRDYIRDWLIEAKVSGNRLSNAAFSGQESGDDVTTFLRGRRMISRARAGKLLAAIACYPDGWPTYRGGRQADYSRAVHISQSDPERERRDIEAKRDAAAQSRADWIEQQRQAEIARYGFTTIAGDVMEMAA